MAGILLAVGLQAGDAEAGKKKRCKKGVRCEDKLPGAPGAGGGGFQLSLPWPAGFGEFYDDPNDQNPGGIGLVIGGKCGHFEGQGSHRDQGDNYSDDRHAMDFGVCGKKDKGIPVLAAHSGRVVEAKSDGEYGQTVVVKSEAGDIATRYAHLGEIAKGIKKNQEVNKNEQIGEIGNSGDTRDPHLHFAAYSADGKQSREIEQIGGYLPGDSRFVVSRSIQAKPAALTFEPEPVGQIPANQIVEVVQGQSVEVGFDVRFPTPLDGFDSSRHFLRPRDQGLAQRFFGTDANVSGQASADPTIGQFRPTLVVPTGAEKGDYELIWEVVDGPDRLVGNELVRLLVRVLERPSPTLNVVSQGPGSVSGTGISCPDDCSETYERGTTVTLTATPSANARFDGWSRACSGTGTCTVEMDEAKNVTASFSALPKLHIEVLQNGSFGEGTVRGPNGLSCTSSCDFYFQPGTPVTLTADTSTGSVTFGGWSGACSGFGNCNLTMNGDRNVVAQFN